jgi:hypothetical protein
MGHDPIPLSRIGDSAGRLQFCNGICIFVAEFKRTSPGLQFHCAPCDKEPIREGAGYLSAHRICELTRSSPRPSTPYGHTREGELPGHKKETENNPRGGCDTQEVQRCLPSTKWAMPETRSMSLVQSHNLLIRRCAPKASLNKRWQPSWSGRGSFS